MSKQGTLDSWFGEHQKVITPKQGFKYPRKHRYFVKAQPLSPEILQWATKMEKWLHTNPSFGEIKNESKKILARV